MRKLLKQAFRGNSINIVTYFLVTSAVICLFSFVTADPDLWGHIKFGEDLWHSKKLVRFDPYSFTAQGRPWINHEWLSELIFFATYRCFGDAGLLFGKLGIGLSIVVMLTIICGSRKKNPLAYALIMVLGIYVISPGFMIRPQVFSYLLFSLFYYVLHFYFDRHKNILFLLPCLMVLWVNLHGGFLMGLTFLATVIVWKTIARLIFRNADCQLGYLWFWLIITSLSTLVNPYGYELLTFFYKTLSVHRDISEWGSVILWDMSYLHLKIVIVLFIISICIDFKKKIIGWEVVGIFMTLFASLKYQRHMPFFGILVTPYLVFQFSEIASSIQSRFPRFTLSASYKKIIVLLLCLFAVYQFYSGINKYIISRCRIIIPLQEYPVAAIQFLKINNIKGNLLLPFTWGEYAIWKLYPDCRVSIDGRFRTIYPESVIRDHLISGNDSNGWKTLIDKYPADILLVRQTPFFHSLIQQKKDKWIYAYSDSNAIIYLYENEVNRRLLEENETSWFEYPKTSPSYYFP